MLSESEMVLSLQMSRDYGKKMSSSSSSSSSIFLNVIIVKRKEGIYIYIKSVKSLTRNEIVYVVPPTSQTRSDHAEEERGT